MVFIPFQLSKSKVCLNQGLPTWCPRAPGCLQGPCRSSAGLF